MTSSVRLTPFVQKVDSAIHWLPTVTPGLSMVFHYWQPALITYDWHNRKGTGTRHTGKHWWRKNLVRWKNPAWRKTVRANESHDQCSELLGIRMPKDRWPQALKALLLNSSLHFNAFHNCIAKMEVGCLEYSGAFTFGSQPLAWNNAPMTGTTAQPSHESPH